MVNKFLQAMRRHIPMKILSLVIAFILWNYVLVTVDPPRTRTVQDVDITIQGEDRLDALSLIVVGDMDELINTADVDVTVHLSQLEQITPQKIQITADLSGIREPGTYQVDLKAETQIGDITKISPASVQLEVEERVSKLVPVVVSYTGELSKDLHLQEAVLATSTVRIYGRQEDVSKAVRAICTVDLSTITANDTRAYTVRVTDEKGNDLTDRLNNRTELSTIVSTKVSAKKEMPLDLTVENVLRDAAHIAEGFELVGMTYTPQTVELVGDAATLAQMETVNFERISVRGLEETTEFVLKLSLPEGVTCITPFDIVVTVEIQPLPEPTPEETEA